MAHELSTGFVILLNSRQANVPPGLRTRWASFSTAGIDVQFRMPNAMVYRSYVFEGMCDMSCAFASAKDTCWAGNKS